VLLNFLDVFFVYLKEVHVFAVAHAFILLDFLFWVERDPFQV
jgi:hypothetical protein